MKPTTRFRLVMILTMPFALMATLVSAATITFNDLPTEAEFYDLGRPSVYVENNITATAPGVFASNHVAGAVHIDDSGTSFPWEVSITTSNIFNALSFDIISAGFAESPYQNIMVQGFLRGSIAVSTAFTMHEIIGTSERFNLGAEYYGIDMLQISANFSNNGFCAPCGHFDLDAITISDTISPVPVPPSLLLLMLAMGSVLIVAGRKGSA